MKFNIFERVKQYHESKLKAVGLHQSMGLPYWRERLFIENLLALLVLGLFAYVPGVIFAIKEELYAIALVDTVVICTIFSIFLLNGIPTRVKVLLMLSFIYLLGVFLLISLGPYGAGLVWLIGFSILTTLFLGLNAAFISIGINVLTIFILGIGIKYQIAATPFFEGYSIAKWITVGINATIVSAISTLSLAIVIQGLQNSLSTEKKLLKSLQDESKRLAEAKLKAEESDKLKTTFLANMSHEIRTPMNGIIGFCNLLQAEGFDPKTRDYYAEVIMSSSTRLLDTINEILDISKLEIGMAEVFQDEIELNALIKELHDFFTPLAKNKGLQLNAYVGSNQALNLFSDKEKLFKILNNLISNAIKFTKQGQVNFGYEIKNQELHFFVEDTGIGIDIQNHETIFERFRQVQSNYTNRADGTGLGLAIVKSLVDLLGGKIWLSSELGKGATFKFTISYNPIDKFSEDTDKTDIQSPSFTHWKDRTILIAEDEESNFQLAKAILKPYDLIILRARDGLEAVEMCHQREKIDLVLMDIKMPRMDGYEATERIKEKNPGIPIIAQTAFAMKSDVLMSQSVGCNDFISKPIDREKLLEMMDKWLSLEKN